MKKFYILLRLSKLVTSDFLCTQYNLKLFYLNAVSALSLCLSLEDFSLSLELWRTSLNTHKIEVRNQSIRFNQPRILEDTQSLKIRRNENLTYLLKLRSEDIRRYENRIPGKLPCQDRHKKCLPRSFRCSKF